MVQTKVSYYETTCSHVNWFALNYVLRSNQKFVLLGLYLNHALNVLVSNIFEGKHIHVHKTVQHL